MNAHLNYRPKIDKIVEAMLYIAHHRPGADKYQVVKFLYLADKEHINRYGRPITQERYWALPYGPVASTALDMIDGKFTFSTEIGIDGLPFVINRSGRYAALGEPHREVDLDLFSKSDISVLSHILKEYGDRTFDELFKLTHRHEAYSRAWARKRVGANAAPMYYEEMIEDRERRAAMLYEYADIAQFIE